MFVTGNPVSGGYALGRAFVHIPFAPVIDRTPLQLGAEEAAVEAFFAARAIAVNELAAIQARMQSGNPAQAAIFEAHKEIANDIGAEEEILFRIREEHMPPSQAVEEAFDMLTELLAGVEDPLIRERVSDMRDVKLRLLRCIEGLPERDLSRLEEPVIIVAHDLFPSDTAALDKARVLAIVTEVGGSTCHTAIIARSFEIPAVLGVPDALNAIRHGDLVAVDAVKGVIHLEPSPGEQAQHLALREDYLREAEETKRYLQYNSKLADGTKIEVELNIGSAEEQELKASAYTDGVGLFRTEFLFMGRSTLPSEEEQFHAYQRVLKRFGDRPVTIRTLDVGGDKQPECIPIPAEANPFMGNRALRLCFERPELLHTQLRACLRAGVYGNLWLMFPMVGSMDDIRRAKAAVKNAQNELKTEGIPYTKTLKIGIMIEIPSIALLAHAVAQEVDFASIGTNDLTQYTLAVDRMNSAVAAYYQSYHPALFHLIGSVAKSFTAASKPLAVCGELGGDKLAAAVLIGMGIHRLSMGKASVAPLKRMLSGLTLNKAEEAYRHTLSCSTADEVERYLKDEIGTIGA